MCIYENDTGIIPLLITVFGKKTLIMWSLVIGNQKVVQHFSIYANKGKWQVTYQMNENFTLLKLKKQKQNQIYTKDHY